FNAPLIPDGHLVVLNKAPYEDRMDEIIVDGEVLASLRFEIESCEWVLLPRLEGARRLFEGRDKKTLKKWVVIEQGVVPFILKKGASVLAPGVLDADPEIKREDEVVVLNPAGEVICCGRARMTGKEMCEEKRGHAVKPRWSGEPEPQKTNPSGQSWEDAVKANEKILDGMIEKSHAFIKNVAGSMDMKVSVSYSGGKDSLAVLQLVDESLEDYEIMFADTGLEFPETLENVKQVVEYYGKKLRTTSAGDSFWDSISVFGPPTMDTRWCCKICKLGPITQLIDENYKGGCLSFIGQRKYESHARSISKRVWKNPWVGNQIGASPIQDWTALHIWLYLFSTKAPYNTAYETGYDRMGCWLCTSSSLADFFQLEESHPELAKKLNSHLLAYAEKTGLSPEWVKYGLWRYRRYPRVLQELAEKNGISLFPSQEAPKKLNFEVATGYRPCKAGGISADGSFGQAIDIETLEESGMLSPIGKVSFIDGAASVAFGESRAQVFASGNVNGRSDNEKTLKKLMKIVEFSVRRALLCQGCGVCVGHCEHNAIEMKEKKVRIKENCIHCGACIEVCPLVKFI
ncbi:MAG: phosphoadenosine phosphosulfate reductase family protein, partial [Methanosarcina sp.]|nr:phosphoadenosine phosphosulfate reductase family protein [Methanosarcina sp.]